MAAERASLRYVLLLIGAAAGVYSLYYAFTMRLNLGLIARSGAAGLAQFLITALGILGLVWFTLALLVPRIRAGTLGLMERFLSGRGRTGVVAVVFLLGIWGGAVTAYHAPGMERWIGMLAVLLLLTHARFASSRIR